MEQGGDEALGKDVINHVALKHNLQAVDYCRIMVSAVGGCVAGILGLTNLEGFIFYFGASGAMTVLLTNKTANKQFDYFQGTSQVALDGIAGNLLSYVLFWTFIYGLVHVY
eukprot:comp25344_c0_seq1/m.46989 comp25344_c0_seq1/g.46989  ORF comp25344_c0_seq1/g.46989 comp25344_c0_seq1/m.46989 type:complete len:111 (-) comp25344_c0_seq1:683-1015(-)